MLCFPSHKKKKKKKKIRGKKKRNAFDLLLSIGCVADVFFFSWSTFGNSLVHWFSIPVHCSAPFACLPYLKGEVVCGQVWWPILEICALHLSIQVHTHSSEHTPGAVGGSVPCSRSHLSRGIEMERVLVIHSPHQQSLPDLRLEPTTFGLQVQLSIH